MSATDPQRRPTPVTGNLLSMLTARRVGKAKRIFGLPTTEPVMSENIRRTRSAGPGSGAGRSGAAGTRAQGGLGTRGDCDSRGPVATQRKREELPLLPRRRPGGEARRPCEAPGLSESRSVTLTDGSRKPRLAFPAHPSRQQGHRDRPGRGSPFTPTSRRKVLPLKRRPTPTPRSRARVDAQRGAGLRRPLAPGTGKSQRGGEDDQGHVNHLEGFLARGPVSERLRDDWDVDYIAVPFSSARPSPPRPSGVRGLFEREEAFLKWRVMDRLNPYGAF